VINYAKLSISQWIKDEMKTFEGRLQRAFRVTVISSCALYKRGALENVFLLSPPLKNEGQGGFKCPYDWDLACPA
jgi:hypothetical protein